MRKTFKVHKVTKTIYLPKDVRQEGFDEELDGYMNAVTLTLVRPGTNLTLAIESLQGVIKDFELRKKAGMERLPAEKAGQEPLEDEEPNQPEPSTDTIARLRKLLGR